MFNKSVKTKCRQWAEVSGMGCMAIIFIPLRFCSKIHWSKLTLQTITTHSNGTWWNQHGKHVLTCWRTETVPSRVLEYHPCRPHPPGCPQCRCSATATTGQRDWPVSPAHPGNGSCCQIDPWTLLMPEPLPECPLGKQKQQESIFRALQCPQGIVGQEADSVSEPAASRHCYRPPSSMASVKTLNTHNSNNNKMQYCECETSIWFKCWT